MKQIIIELTNDQFRSWAWLIGRSVDKPITGRETDAKLQRKLERELKMIGARIVAEEAKKISDKILSGKDEVKA